MEIIALFLSFLSIFLTICFYLKHDKKIKEQTFILNNYKISQINKEEIDQKKAYIEANVTFGEKGTRNINISNKGKSEARDVIILVPEEKGYTVFKKLQPFNLLPDKNFKFEIKKFAGGPDQTELTFKWSDASCEINESKQTIQI